MFGNAFTEKRGDIGRFRHVLKPWQAGEIELRRCIVFGDRAGRHPGVGSRRFTIRPFRLLLALRPSRKKALVFVALVRTAHGRPVPSSGAPPGICWRSPPARSRLRLWNTRSTWNWSTKAAIHDAISAGIGTVPITSQPLSNIAS